MSDSLHLSWKSRRQHTVNEPDANSTSLCSVLRALIGSALRTGCFRFGLLHEWNVGRHGTFVFLESVPEMRCIRRVAGPFSVTLAPTRQARQHAATHPLSYLAGSSIR